MSGRPKSRLVFRTDNTPKFSEDDVEKIELTAVTPNLEWNIGRRIVFESELKEQQYESQNGGGAYDHEEELEQSPPEERYHASSSFGRVHPDRDDNYKSLHPSPGKISFAAPGSKQKPEILSSPQKSEASFRGKPRWSNKQLSSGSKGNPFASHHKKTLEDSPVGAFSGNKNSNTAEPSKSKTLRSVRGPNPKQDTSKSVMGQQTPKHKAADKHVWVAEVKRETKLMEQKIQDFERKFEERASMLVYYPRQVPAETSEETRDSTSPSCCC